MNKTYTFKQVIFGLRKEYLDVEKQLKNLKKYVNKSNRVEDFYFHTAGNPCSIFLYLETKKSLLEKLETLLGTYIMGQTNFEVTRDIKDAYFHHKKKICSINNIDELKEKIDEIMQTNFIKNIVANNHNGIPCIENKINSLSITSSSIHLLNSFTEIYPFFDYYPRWDEIIMRNKEKVITPDDIFNILNLSLNGSFLNDYHCSILDNYEEKEIDIDDNFDSSLARLEIIEEPKKLILKQKN